MSRNYKFKNPEGLYFVSFAVINWMDVFIRPIYFDCLVTNLNYCVEKKGMKIYAWCIMTNHVHLVFKSTVQKPEDLLRDFKTFTSKQLLKLIQENFRESRREWLMCAFAKAGKANSNNTHFQFWQQHNHPIELWSNKFIDQKINYILANPVKAGFVEYDYEYLHSSARDYCDVKGLVNIVREE